MNCAHCNFSPAEEGVRFCRACIAGWHRAYGLDAAPLPLCPTCGAVTSSLVFLHCGDCRARAKAKQRRVCNYCGVPTSGYSTVCSDCGPLLPEERKRVVWRGAAPKPSPRKTAEVIAAPLEVITPISRFCPLCGHEHHRGDTCHEGTAVEPWIGVGARSCGHSPSETSGDSDISGLFYRRGLLDGWYYFNGKAF